MSLSTDYVIGQMKAIKKETDDAQSKRILQFKDSRLFNFDDTSEWSEIFTTMEGLGESKELTEAETPPVRKLEEGYQLSLAPKRYGSAIEITEQMREMAGDSTIKMNKRIIQERNQTLVSNYKMFLDVIFKAYNEAFNAGGSMLAPDGVELCGEHVWKTAGAPHWTNKITDSFDEDAWDKVMEFGGAFKDASGREMPISYDTIVVKLGSIAAKDARKQFANNISATKVGDTNIYEGSVRVIETPMIADKLNWFAIDSTVQHPVYVGILNFPKMRTPIKQNNEAIRSNCTGFYKAGITQMPFALFGSDGTNA